MSENSIQFVAQVREVKSKALVSLDKSIRVVLETPVLEVMDIGRWPADETVAVIIERMPNKTKGGNHVQAA